jgi:hypothetical protein
MLGTPVEFENRTVMGVDGLVKCVATESLDASTEGVNVPEKRIPFAWAVYDFSAHERRIKGTERDLV